MSEILEILGTPFLGYIMLWFIVWKFRPGGIFRYGGYFGFADQESLRKVAKNTLTWLTVMLFLGLLFISNPREHLMRDGFTIFLGMLVAFIHISNIGPRRN